MMRSNSWTTRPLPFLGLRSSSPWEHQTVRVKPTSHPNGKAPKLGVLIEVRSAHLRTDPSLTVSGADVPTIGALVADERSGRSMKGRAAAALTDKFTALDYKFKLY